jgi:hypothetical protein
MGADRGMWHIWDFPPKEIHKNVSQFMANISFGAQIRNLWNPSGNQRALASIAPAAAP